MSTQQPWAMVTGASSGLGREFAVQLAQQGYNLVLTARRQSVLDELATELRNSSTIQVAVIPADLTSADQVQQLLSELERRQINIELLISNAGMGHFGPFAEQTTEQIQEMLRLNIEAPTLLLHQLAQKMHAAGRGQILQVSSYAGLQPIPRYSVYSAAKSYAIALIQALRYEYRKSPVKLAVLAPGFMQTGFHEAAGHEHTRWMKMLSLTPASVVTAGLAGLKKGQWLITPGWWYKINNVVARFLPRSLGSAISAAVVKVKHKRNTTEQTNPSQRQAA
jgi:uncharacterized protein